MYNHSVLLFNLFLLIDCLLDNRQEDPVCFRARPARYVGYVTRTCILLIFACIQYLYMFSFTVIMYNIMRHAKRPLSGHFPPLSLTATLPYSFNDYITNNCNSHFSFHAHDSSKICFTHPCNKYMHVFLETFLTQ